MENQFVPRNSTRAGILKYLVPIGLSFFLFSCTVVEVRDPAVESPGVSEAEKHETENTQSATEGPNVVDKDANTNANNAAEVAGAVLATVANVWLITEYIEEKVVPAVVGLAVAYLIYQASRNAESSEMN